MAVKDWRCAAGSVGTAMCAPFRGGKADYQGKAVAKAGILGEM
jgi:hypothetical protein